MDSIESKKKHKETLLCFTERLTNYEIVFRTSGKTSLQTIKAINYLNSIYGRYFSKIFKSITCDNGSEFTDFTNIMYNSQGKKRTTVYYCHPYCSSERGQNENQNKFIRRYIKKGTVISSYSPEFIKSKKDFINKYPRKKYNYASSYDLFIKEFSKIVQNEYR